MIKSTIGIAVLASLVALGGCATKAETIGAASGLAVGAALDGGAMGKVGGTMVGYAAGRAYDARNN